MSAQIIRLSDYRRRPEPPTNPWADAMAWWMAWMGEYCHAVCTMLRGARP
jgi:hypothetical protein